MMAEKKVAKKPVINKRVVDLGKYLIMAREQYPNEPALDTALAILYSTEKVVALHPHKGINKIIVEA